MWHFCVRGQLLSDAKYLWPSCLWLSYFIWLAEPSITRSWKYLNWQESLVWYLMGELEYAPSAIYHCSFSLISKTISFNIFYGVYSSDQNWNGIGMRNVQISSKKFWGQLDLQGAPSSKFNSSCQPINSFDHQKSLM